LHQRKPRPDSQNEPSNRLQQDGSDIVLGLEPVLSREVFNFSGYDPPLYERLRPGDNAANDE
jgi:hypothetical protein